MITQHLEKKAFEEDRPSLGTNQRCCAYIVFCTGCWSLSWRAGWSGHLFWHRLCAQIRNGTSLYHCSLKTSYTKSNMKGSFTKTQSNKQNTEKLLDRKEKANSKTTKKWRCNCHMS